MRLIRATLLAGLAALAAACSDAEPLTAPETPARTTTNQPNFVYAEANGFKLNGRPFRFVGANTPQLVYQTDDQIRYTLDQLQGSGVRVIRVFLPNDATRGSVWDPWETRSRLKLVLDEAYRRDIRVIVALVHAYLQPVTGSMYWNSGGHVAVFGDRAAGFFSRTYSTPEGDQVHMLDDRWVDWGYARGGGNFRDYVWAIVSHPDINAHPGVFAWDVANELNVSDTWNRWLVDREVAFYKDIAGLIKAANGRRQMVTTGVISSFWAGWSRPSWDLKPQIYGDPNFDYVTVHHYDDNPTNQQREEIAHYAGSRPVVVEEFGMRNAETEFWRVESYFADMYDNRGVDGIMQWGVQYSCPRIGGADWGSGDRVFGPCEQNRLPDYRALWQNRSLRLAAGQLRSQYDNKCVSSPSATPVDRTRLHMWDCLPVGHGSRAQQEFTMSPTGELRMLGKCVTANVNLDPGRELVLWPCGSAYTQKWSVDRDGFMRARDAGNRCWSVDRGHLNQHGAMELVVWDCVDHPVQKWRIGL